MTEKSRVATAPEKSESPANGSIAWRSKVPRVSRTSRNTLLPALRWDIARLLTSRFIANSTADIVAEKTAAEYRTADDLKVLER